MRQYTRNLMLDVMAGGIAGTMFGSGMSLVPFQFVYGTCLTVAGLCLILMIGIAGAK